MLLTPESRGSEQKELGNDQVPNGKPRSRSSSRESNKSGARASQRGSPTPAGASRREIEVKKDMFVVDIQSAMELAKLKLNNGLKELAIIAQLQLGRQWSQWLGRICPNLWRDHFYWKWACLRTALIKL